MAKETLHSEASVLGTEVKGRWKHGVENHVHKQCCGEGFSAA